MVLIPYITARQGLGLLRSIPLISAAMLSACVYFPKAGPLRGDVTDEYRKAGNQPFALVPVTEHVLSMLDSGSAPGFAEFFGDVPVIEPRLGIGDSVTLVVFEAGSETLFASAAPVSGSPGGNAGGASRGVSLPAQTIALDGTVSLPFAGPLKAVGLTERQLAAEAERALAGRASHPQVLVSASRGPSGAVTVLGEQGPGVRVPLTAFGERLLDVIASSGGLRGAVFDTQIELRRDGRALRLPMSRVLASPTENLRLQAGDLLLVTRQPQTFTVFGATGRVAQIDFAADHVNLAEAVARAGGLLDSRADPHAVYVFRQEDPALVSRFSSVSVPTASVVYQFDFSRAASYFISQRFRMRDGDVLYVASAPTNELQKFLQLLGILTQPVLSGFAVDNAVK